jgi:nitrogen fixation/metabolism regulation signal transduction histidine kinase
MVTKIDAREIAQPQKDLKNYIVLLSVLIVIIVFLLASILALSIVRPIDDLTEAADRISKGDLSVQIIVKSHDEIGRLAESFERMLAAIKFFKEDKG